MALIDDVKAVCDRLGPLGWRDLLLRVTQNQLDIVQATPAALQAALAANLTSVDRGFAGFTDFAGDGHQGVTPGEPARSLLYHALVSPGVTTGVAGPLSSFPTLRELEVVENYVFGVKPPKLSELRQRAGLTGTKKLTVVVFAYEYRPARDSCSRLRADLAFARTGIARGSDFVALRSPPRESNGSHCDR